MEITWFAVLTVHRSIAAGPCRRVDCRPGTAIGTARGRDRGDQRRKRIREAPEQEADGPEDVRWIAALDDVEASPEARFEAESEGGEEGVQILDDEGRP